MATRTAIAAKDRQARKDIADADRRENRRQYEKSYKQKEFEANSKHLANSAKAVKDLAGATGTLGALMNDPEWYKKFNLSNYSVNLPTFYRLGSQLKQNWLKQNVYDTVPGIAVINFHPTLPNNYENGSWPNNNYQTSPINQSLTRFMAEIRKLNSRVGEYDPSDLGLYWYSVIGIIYALGRLTKALKFYNTYYAENRYFAKACIRSCGFDVTDFLANVPEYKARLMKWIELFNSNVVLPKSLDLLKRAFWIANVVVREHKTNCSQIYHFNSICDMRLDDEEQNVKFTLLTSELKFANYTTNIEYMIQTLFNSVGVVTMTADLRAAFPDSVLLKYPEFHGDEIMTYSESVHDLEQIHNLRTLPVNLASFGTTDGDIFSSSAGQNMSHRDIIVDNDGYLVQGAVSGGNILPLIYNDTQTNRDKLPIYANGTDANFLNFYDSDYVSDDAILEATRLRSILNDYDSNLGGAAIKFVGTELVTDIVLMIADVTQDYFNCVYVYTEIDNDITIDITNQQALALADASTFDWLPIIQFFASDDDDWRYTFGEIDHAVYISNQNLKLIHEGCSFSLFYVSDFGKSHVG